MFNIPTPLDPSKTREAQAQWFESTVKEMPVKVSKDASQGISNKSVSENNERSALDAGRLKNLIGATKHGFTTIRGPRFN